MRTYTNSIGPVQSISLPRYGPMECLFAHNMQCRPSAYDSRAQRSTQANKNTPSSARHRTTRALDIPERSTVSLFYVSLQGSRCYPHRLALSRSYSFEPIEQTSPLIQGPEPKQILTVTEAAQASVSPLRSLLRFVTKAHIAVSKVCPRGERTLCSKLDTIMDAAKRRLHRRTQRTPAEIPHTAA